MTLSTEHYFNTPVIYALVERIFNENFNPTLFMGIKKGAGHFFLSRRDARLLGNCLCGERQTNSSRG